MNYRFGSFADKFRNSIFLWQETVGCEKTVNEACPNFFLFFVYFFFPTEETSSHVIVGPSASRLAH